MKKLLLLLMLPLTLFAQKASVDYNTKTHAVIAPPSAPGATFDYDFTGLNIGGLATGGGGGGGTPGGIDRQLQYNNGSTFGGIPYLLFTGTAVTQQVGSRYFLLDPTDNTKRVQVSIVVPTGTLKTLTISDDSVTVIPSSVTPNQFMTNVNTLGVAVTAQPLFSNLGGTLSLSQTSMSTNKLLGRATAGTGAIEEITLGTGLSFTGTTLNAASGSGIPGGLTSQFQYNNAGVFSGTGFLTFVGGEIDSNTTAWRFMDNTDATKKLSINLTNLPTATSASLMIPLNPVAVTSSAGVANQWVRYIDFLGQQILAQPAFSNLSGSLSLAQQNIPIGKERFVDPTNGSDITGAANLARPYLTVQAACAAASSGDTIYLYPNITGYDMSTSSQVIPAGVTIVGAGSAVTLIKGAATPRAVVEPSTGSAIYNVTIQNTSAIGVAYGVLPASAAFTSAYIGGSKLIANGAAIEVAKAGSTGLVGENLTVQSQTNCLYQDASTAVSEFRNCNFISDGTTTSASIGLEVLNGTVRYNYGDITVGNSTNTNLGVRASGAASTVELHGVRISNSGGGTTNNDVRQISSAFLGVDNVTRPDAGALNTSGTITQLSRYASRDAGLLDYPNLGPATRGDIIYFNGTSWVRLAAGLDGNVLTTHGTTADPNWLTGGGPGGSVSDLAFGPAWNAQTTTGSSQNALYDYFHLMSPADNGKIGVLNIGAGIPKTSSGGIISLATAGTDYTSPTGVEGLSNKRIVKREQAVVAPTPAPTIATDNFDTVHYTGIANDFTSITTSGTPNGSDTLIFDFTDDGTARVIAWDTARFESSPGQLLPTTTVASTRLDVGFRWNPITGKWRCLAASNPIAVSGAGTVTSVGASGSNGVTVGGVPITSSGSISIGLPITLAGTAGKTLTVSNSLTLAGTDGSTLNVGAGGTLGTNAFNSTSFLTATAISDAAYGATWNVATLTAPSKNAVYDEIHTFDTDDNGKVNVLDMGAGLVKTDSGGVVSAATGGTDYADLAFRTVAVSGQSNVVADSAADTLTLAAGSGVTLTTTPGTDTVTIAAATGGVSDGDKGDITVSGSGATWTIDNAAVTYAKIQNVSANSKLLGSSATGSGAPPSEITLGTNLSMSGSTLNATAGGGAVDDTAFGSAWDTVTTTAPSKNVVYDYLHTSMPNDDGKVNLLNLAAGGSIVAYDGGVYKAAVASGVTFNTGTGVLSLDPAFSPPWSAAQTISLDNASNNAVSTPLFLRHNTTGTPAAGLGTALEFDSETGNPSGATNVKLGDLSYAWSNVTNGSRTSYATVNLVNSTTAAEAIRIFPTKALGVGITTDPGAGYIDVSTGYKINGTVVGVPGGSTTQVQFNNAGAFGGDAGITLTPATTDSAKITLTGTGGTAWSISAAGSVGAVGYYPVNAISFYNATTTNIPFTISGENVYADSVSVIGWQNAGRGGTLDTGLYRNAGGTVEINNGTPGSYRDLICRNITISGGNFTGRINPRASGGCDETSSATSTPNSDACDQWDITALAAADVFVAPSGTPVNGQSLIIRILDNGTARALTFPTASSGQYRFSSDMPAPTTTVISKTMYLGFKWNAAASRWDNVAQMNNF